MNQPTDVNSGPQKIEAHTVSLHARAGTLPRHFGRHMLTFEGMVYDLMGQYASQYSGAMWAYLELSNGSFYMTPLPEESYHLIIPSNGYDGKMTADAAGITVCLFAYSLLSFDYPGTQMFARHFHRLRDFALEHAESGQIFAAID